MQIGEFLKQTTACAELFVFPTYSFSRASQTRMEVTMQRNIVRTGCRSRLQHGVFLYGNATCM